MHEPLTATLDAFVAKGVVGACAAVMPRGDTTLSEWLDHTRLISGSLD